MLSRARLHSGTDALKGLSERHGSRLGAARPARSGAHPHQSGTGGCVPRGRHDRDGRDQSSRPESQLKTASDTSESGWKIAPILRSASRPAVDAASAQFKCPNAVSYRADSLCSSRRAPQFERSWGAESDGRQKIRLNTRYNSPDNSIAAGSVRTQARAIFRKVCSCNPEPFAAIVPATPDDSTWVVDTGNP
jgi:hypothetical protein